MKRNETDKWKLNVVDDIPWTQDESGVYVIINWDMLTESARLDIMVEAKTEPIQSFVGKADNVRKATMQWFNTPQAVSACGFDGDCRDYVSLEHAAYIGAELERCDTERIDYVQD